MECLLRKATGSELAERTGEVMQTITGKGMRVSIPQPFGVVTDSRYRVAGFNVCPVWLCSDLFLFPCCFHLE